MAKSFFDVLKEYDCDSETQKQIINTYRMPFFVNPFENMDDFVKWCVEWEKARKNIKNFTA